MKSKSALSFPQVASWMIFVGKNVNKKTAILLWPNLADWRMKALSVLFDCEESD